MEHAFWAAGGRWPNRHPGGLRELAKVARDPERYGVPSEVLDQAVVSTRGFYVIGPAYDALVDVFKRGSNVHDFSGRL